MAKSYNKEREGRELIEKVMHFIKKKAHGGVCILLSIDRVPYISYLVNSPFSALYYKYGNFCCSLTPCHHFGHRLQ